MNQKLNNQGSIEVICGCMFSGKTEELIRRVRRAQIARMSVIVFKPIIDARYSKTEVVSHNNDKINSHPVSKCLEIIQHSDNYNVIGIDEAQFFDGEIVETCRTLSRKGKRIIIFIFGQTQKMKIIHVLYPSGRGKEIPLRNSTIKL